MTFWSTVGAVVLGLVLFVALLIAVKLLLAACSHALYVFGQWRWERSIRRSRRHGV